MNSKEAQKRQKLALEAIGRAFGSNLGAASVSLFADHHIEDVPAEYWIKQLGTNAPNAKDVVGLLQFRRSWGENDIEYFDYTLPGEITQYVISVKFDSAGEIKDISMES